MAIIVSITVNLRRICREKQWWYRTIETSNSAGHRAPLHRFKLHTDHNNNAPIETLGDTTAAVNPSASAYRDELDIAPSHQKNTVHFVIFCHDHESSGHDDKLFGDVRSDVEYTDNQLSRRCET